MSVDIDDITLDSIQEFTISKSQDVDEVDLDSKQTNTVFLGEVSAYNFGIDFTSKNTTKSDLESLYDKEFYEATFSYNGFDGFLSINNINFPESSDTSNLIQGSIEGYFLPKPKFTISKLRDTEETTFEIAFESAFVG